MDLAKKLRRIPGVPVLYLHGNAMQLERTSKATLEAAGSVAKEKQVPKHEQDTLKELYEQEGIVVEDEEGPIHHKKKLKGMLSLPSFLS